MVHQRLVFLVLASFWFACPGLGQTSALQAFPLRSVRLLEGPFKRAEQTDLAYILSLDPDRLLAPFRKEAGLPPRKPVYGNWEADGLGGHTAGHVLSALSMMVAATGDPTAADRLDYMLRELKHCQDQRADGYLGGVPDGPVMWADITRGQIDAGNFSLNDKWVPWYNLHKLYAGLRDAYRYAERKVALEMLVDLSDWALRLTAGLSDAQMQDMLQAEHGGMNEVFADLYAITGSDQYLELARRFSHRALLDPLLAGTDQLTGLHANTQIPKVIGYERIGALGDRPDWQEAARFFWERVAGARSVAFGGNSVREHFNPVNDFSGMLHEVQGPETCNTYNMLRLSQLLYLADGDTRYLDLYERGLYNHILSSQHPERGGFVYFTPIRPGHYRVYSQSQQCFWCCVGSGMENHAKYGELIYAHDERDLYVNLFIPSRLQWAERGLTLVQQTAFPDEEKTVLRIEVGEPQRFRILIRRPAWLPEGPMNVTVNGEKAGRPTSGGQYLAIDRAWSDGDRIELALPMTSRLEQLPDGSPYFAIMHGPILLAAQRGEQHLEGLVADDARMGHVAAGPRYPLHEAPALVGSPKKVVDALERRAGDELVFDLAGPVFPDSLSGIKLIPFFRLHDARYMMYWRLADRAELADWRAELAAAESDRLALEARTVDQVAPGEQQSEADHYFRGEATESGLNGERHWRHARAWFSYRLRDPDRSAELLRITYFGLDEGRRFDILLNGDKLATVELEGGRGPEFFSVDYPIPNEWQAARSEDQLELRFEAHPNALAGGIYGIRLLRKKVNQ